MQEQQNQQKQILKESEKTWGDTFSQWVEYFTSFFYFSQSQDPQKNFTIEGQQLDIFLISLEHKLQQLIQNEQTQQKSLKNLLKQLINSPVRDKQKEIEQFQALNKLEQKMEKLQTIQNIFRDLKNGQNTFINSLTTTHIKQKINENNIQEMDKALLYDIQTILINANYLKLVLPNQQNFNNKLQQVLITQQNLNPNLQNIFIQQEQEIENNDQNNISQNIDIDLDSSVQIYKDEKLNTTVNIFSIQENICLQKINEGGHNFQTLVIYQTPGEPSPLLQHQQINNKYQIQEQGQGVGSYIQEQYQNIAEQQ